MELTKACTKCGEVKPFSEFHKHRLTKDGHAYQCKECGRERAKAWRSTPTGIYANIRSRATFYKNHCQRLYKPMTMTKEEFVEWYLEKAKICVYCDIKEEYLERTKTRLEKHVKRLSIDCRDNTKGYSPDNMVLACYTCNTIKSDLFSFDEMRDIAQRHIKPKWMARLKRQT